MEMGVGVSIIQNFADHPHSLYKALAEFIDNSIQAYFDEARTMEKLYRKHDEKLKIRINYNRAKKYLEVIDNSTGIYEDVLRQAFLVGTKIDRKNADNSLGQFNMGFKTAAVWLCDFYEIETKRHDEEESLYALVDHNAIKMGDATLKLECEKRPEEGDKSYTRFKLHDLKHDFTSATIENTISYLSSIYRHLLKGITIEFNGDPIKWNDFKIEYDIENKRDYKWPLDRGYLNPKDPNSPEIHGWVGILKTGAGGSSSTKNSGFSVFRRNRMIQGWPDPWKPPKAMKGGSNTSANQRIFGEIFCDQAKVSFSKDYIDPEHMIQIDTYLAGFMNRNDIAATAQHLLEEDEKEEKTKRQTKSDAKVIKLRLEKSDIGDKTLTSIPPEELIKIQLEQSFNEAPKSDITTISLKKFNVKYLFTHLGEDAPFVQYEVKGGSAKDVYVMINRDHPYLLVRVIDENDYAEFVCCMCIARYKIEKDERLTMDSFFNVLNDVLSYRFK